MACSLRTSTAIHLRTHVLAFEACCYYPKRTGFDPLQCDLSVLVSLHAASSFIGLRTQAHSDSQTEQLQRAGHEPVCPVPGVVDNYLPVPNCTLQKSLGTHSEGSLLC